MGNGTPGSAANGPMGGSAPLGGVAGHRGGPAASRSADPPRRSGPRSVAELTRALTGASRPAPAAGPPPLPGADLLARLPLPQWLTGRRARELVSTASLIAVAMVPGAAMAGGAITVAASAYCGFGSFCLYSGPDFDGDRVEYPGSQQYCQGGRPGLNVRAAFPDGVRSIVNNTSTSGGGVGVKLYSEPAHLIVTSIRPGGEQRDLADTIAMQINSLCVYPNK